MGIIDELLAGATGEAQRTAARSPTINVQMVLDLIHGFPGGLQGVLQRLSTGGLGDQVQSWIGPGANARLPADQLMQALGSRHLQRVAQHFGVDQELVANSVADLLPDLVDRLTPAGHPDTEVIEGGLSRLKGVMRGI